MTDPARQALTFLLDVDNTLLDNDCLKRDIGVRVENLVGKAGADRFWDLYEQVRVERDYVDYPATVRRFGDTLGDPEIGDRLWRMLEGMDFARYLYPGALAVLRHLRQFGPVVILSDGDQTFQRLKIRRSGLEQAVDGRVLIYVHKEEELVAVFETYPADHYVIVDDKERILSALEECCAATFTTVQVLQGHYARAGTYARKPDYVVPSIGDLLGFTKERFTNVTGASYEAR